MRFHLDENIEAGVAEGLRRRGVDVTTVQDAGLRGAADEEHIAFALHEDRVLVTHDVDFLRMHAEGAPHAGIVFCPFGSLTIGDIVRSLSLLHECCTADEMRRALEFLG